LTIWFLFVEFRDLGCDKFFEAYYWMLVVVHINADWTGQTGLLAKHAHHL